MRADDEVCCGQKDKGNEHTKGDGQCHEEGIHHSHEEHEDDEHQHEADDDRVDEVIERVTRLSALVTRDHYIEIFGQASLHLFDNSLDRIGGLNEVFT